MNAENKPIPKTTIKWQEFIKDSNDILLQTNELLANDRLKANDRVQAEIKIVQEATINFQNKVIDFEKVHIPEASDPTYEGIVNKICHDLYNPVNAIKGYTEMLLEDLSDGSSADVKVQLDKIVERINAINHHISEINIKHKIPGYISDSAKQESEKRYNNLDAQKNLKATILVVDDEVLNLNLMHDWLVAKGYKIIKAKSGIEAIKKIEENPNLDLILLDILMPDMSGLEVIQKLRKNKQYNDLPILVLSAVYDTESIVECINSGADDYILKPYNSYLLSARIRACLDRKLLRDRDRENKEQLKLITNSLPVLICAIDNNYHFIFNNNVFEEWFKKPLADITGRHISSIFPEDVYRNIEENWDRLALSETVRFETSFDKEDNKLSHFLVTLTPHLVDGKVKSVFIAMSDITYIKEAEKSLNYIANHDLLTKLPNRNLLDVCLAQAVARADRVNRLFAVFFLDLDQFKLINDNLGHKYGDLLLVEVAKRLQNSMRSSDIIIRMGGDEFILVVENVTNKKELRVLADKLCSVVAQPIMIDDHIVHVTASIGISIYPENSNAVQNLISYADLAMYHAKENHRNGYQFYDDSLKSKAANKLMVSAELKNALANNEMVLHYQPIINLETKEISHFEALIRWNHPKNGLIMPANFLPYAENTGFIHEINSWVITAAAQQYNEWKKQGVKLVPISINVSPRQFLDGNLIKHLSAIIEAHELGGKQIELEITEHALADYSELSIARMRTLKSMGIKIVVDDFGTAYSSLNYLRRLPVDGIKIDISFIRDLNIDKAAKIIVKSIINLAHSLNLKVVAEGVETQFQYDFLREQGCDMIQGYLFSPAIDAGSALNKYLLEN